MWLEVFLLKNIPFKTVLLLPLQEVPMKKTLASAVQSHDSACRN